MRSRLALALVVLSSLLLPLAAPPSPAAAAGCQFILGFKALHDLIPSVVGSCVVDEHHNPDNGDALQETTGVAGKGGLLVWRKSDNWTAYTDGYRTWVNGPRGLQTRLNTERFPWEAGAAPAAGCVVPTEAVTFEGAQVGGDGSVIWRGSVRNPCGSTTTLMVDVRARRSKDGPAFADAPTALVRDVPPGATGAISTRFTAAAAATSFSWRVAAVDPIALGCLGPGDTRCLTADPQLASAIWALRGIAEGGELIKAASDGGVRVIRSDTPRGKIGSYTRAGRLVAIDRKLDAYSMWVRGAVLAHELRHAADDASGKWPTTSAQCYLEEESAFRTSAHVWAAMWENYLPDDVDEIHSELNAITLAVSRDPVGFASALHGIYREECEG